MDQWHHFADRRSRGLNYQGRTERDGNLEQKLTAAQNEWGVTVKRKGERKQNPQKRTRDRDRLDNGLGTESKDKGGSDKKDGDSGCMIIQK